jgi:dihydroneopterin aldolase
MDMKTDARIMQIHPLVWNREEERDVRALFVRGLMVPARIGVHHQEHDRAQRLRIDLCAYLRPPFQWNDRLEDVLDYDRLREGILQLLAQGHINLLETLGERIVQMCLAYPQVHAVHVQLTKLEAHEDCEVGYEAFRKRP